MGDSGERGEAAAVDLVEAGGAELDAARDVAARLRAAPSRDAVRLAQPKRRSTLSNLP